jgi:hypothetical protein
MDLYNILPAFDSNRFFTTRDLKIILKIAIDYFSIDVKITNSKMFRNFEMIANSGPTHEQQPLFQCSTSKISPLRHDGQPDVWNISAHKIKWSPNILELYKY